MEKIVWDEQELLQSLLPFTASACLSAPLLLLLSAQNRKKKGEKTEDAEEVRQDQDCARMHQGRRSNYMSKMKGIITLLLSNCPRHTPQEHIHSQDWKRPDLHPNTMARCDVSVGLAEWKNSVNDCRDLVPKDVTGMPWYPGSQR